MSLPISRHYRVAIIGGGIAGLTLALILERAKISFVLWEAHASITPEIGAGVGLLPNGLRILDQLGLLEKIESQTAPLQTWYHISGDGDIISVVDTHKYYRYTYGYEGRFLKRSQLLRILYDAIQNKDAVRTSTKLANIVMSPHQVKLVSADGSWVTADVIVGADGIHSLVRRHIDQCVRGSTHNSDRASISETEIVPESQSSELGRKTEFTCIFGISTFTLGLKPGECYSVYRKHSTILVFIGKDGIIFWFVFEHIYRHLNTPSRTCHNIGDIERACESVGHLSLSSTVRFADIFSNRITVRKTILEEGIAPSWHAGRMVIVGDAAHTMVPHAAMGANQAMESAASLANELLRTDEWTTQNIMTAMERYTCGRRGRATGAMKKAAIICRVQLCCPGYENAVKDISRLKFADWMVRGLVSLRGAAVVESLPLTEQGRYYEENVEKIFKRLGHHIGQAEKVEISGLSNEELLELFGWRGSEKG